MEYKAKNTIIEAVQWFKHRDHPLVKKHREYNNYGVISGWTGVCPIQAVSPGDYIITAKNGRICSMNPNIFKELFEPSQEK